LVGHLIRARHGSGQRAEALERYYEFRRRVADELGIDPGPRLRQLHGLLLRDELPSATAAAPSAGPAGDRPPVPAQLPPGATLVDREHQLSWLDRLLDTSSGVGPTLVVISGPAGVGKSALAVTWGRRAAAEFPDGVLFAALGGSDPARPPRPAAEVLPRFLLALGEPADKVPDDPDEQAALYRSLLASRRVLVVLDDARDSAHVRPVLPGGPGSLVVVTSRRRCDGLVARDAARRLVLGPLSDEPAAALIADAAAEAGVPMSAEQARRLAALCGNLPLALRVVAARLAAHPIRSVEGLLAELADRRTRLAALDIEYADTSVRAALDVSYRGLHPAVGGAFRMLGLAPGPSVDPYVVAALCDTDLPGAIRRLHALAEANLVEETAEHRFGMHDLVRLYAAELAETDRREAHRDHVADRAVRRLLDYYLATCDRARRLLYPPRDDLDFADRRIALPPLAGPADALAWFDAEWSNLAALLADTVAAERHRIAWQLVELVSHYLTTQARYPEWSFWANTGLAAARAAGDRDGEALMLIVLATARTRYGQAEDALRDAREALRVATEINDSQLIRTALGNVAGGLYWLGRLPEALSCDQESYRLSVAAGDRMGQAHALNNMSQVERALDRRIDAVEHARAAVELFAGLGDAAHHLMALNNLVELCLELDRVGEAEPLVRQALALSATGRPDLQQAFARELFGRVLLAKGDPAAERELRAALELTEELAAPRADELRALLDELGPHPSGNSGS
jgi:tetratricopeptide (TPR) repeat protein